MSLAMMTKPGMIGTMAGTGDPGYGGDEMIATAARLNEPKNLALDQRGHLYIADAENHVIRRIELDTGRITTVAGTAPDPIRESRGQGSAQVDADDPFGETAEQTPQRFAQFRDVSGTVRFVVGEAAAGRFGGDRGPATAAQLNFPSAVAVDEEGNLYIADTMNHRVRKVDARTGMITTIVGTGQRRFSGDGGPGVAGALNEPSALAVDHGGCLYIADQGNHRVRKLNLRTGIITTVAGTGPATYNGDGIPAVEASLAGPSGLALGPDGTLYIADTFNGRLRKVDAETGLISTVAGDGAEYHYQGVDDESHSLSRPYGIAVAPEGHLLITDSDNHLIRRGEYRKNVITRVAGNGIASYSGDGGWPRESSLNYPFGVAVDEHGNIYVADTFNHRIRVIAAGGERREPGLADTC